MRLCGRRRRRRQAGQDSVRVVRGPCGAATLSGSGSGVSASDGMAPPGAGAAPAPPGAPPGAPNAGGADRPADFRVQLGGPLPTGAEIGGGLPGSGDNPRRAATRRSARRQAQILKQQRWLLFLRHCASCKASQAECAYGGNCAVAKELWHHLVACKDPALRAHAPAAQAPPALRGRGLPRLPPVRQHVERQRQRERRGGGGEAAAPPRGP